MLLISWQRGFPQRMSQKMLVLSVVRPVLALMKAVMSFLILARGSEVSSNISNNKNVGPPCCWAEIYAGWLHAAPVSHDEYADGTDRHTVT